MNLWVRIPNWKKSISKLNSHIAIKTQTGLGFNLWKGKVIFILQRADLLEDLSVLETFERTPRPRPRQQWPSWPCPSSPLFKSRPDHSTATIYSDKFSNINTISHVWVFIKSHNQPFKIFKWYLTNSYISKV